MLLPELDIFVGNVFIIDWEIFKLWLDGHECKCKVFRPIYVWICNLNNVFLSILAVTVAGGDEI